MRKQIRVLDLQILHRSWPITENISSNYPQWLGSSGNLIWLESFRNGHTNLVICDIRLVDNEYTAGTIPSHISNLRATSIPFIKNTNDELGFTVVDKININSSFFNPTEQSSNFSNFSGHLNTTFPKRRADLFSNPQKSVI
jgi:hypothetical protein